jgi:hypothetical protein
MDDPRGFEGLQRDKRPLQPDDNVYCKYCKVSITHQSSYHHVRSDKHALARTHYRVAAANVQEAAEVPRPANRRVDEFDDGTMTNERCNLKITDLRDHPEHPDPLDPGVVCTNPVQMCSVLYYRNSHSLTMRIGFA